MRAWALLACLLNTGNLTILHLDAIIDAQATRIADVVHAVLAVIHADGDAVTVDLPLRAAIVHAAFNGVARHGAANGASNGGCRAAAAATNVVGRQAANDGTEQNARASAAID